MKADADYFKKYNNFLKGKGTYTLLSSFHQIHN